MQNERATLKDLQQALFQLEQRIERVLSAHGILVFGLYGTCLGAVRHKGFIPWDDDLDIGIFRKDYARALNILEKELPEMFVWHWDRDETCPMPFAKVFNKITQNQTIADYQACVDIFPVDNAPSGRIGVVLRCILAITVRRLINRKTFGKDASPYRGLNKHIFSVLAIPFMWMSPRCLRQLYTRIVHGKFHNIAKRVWCFTGGDKECFPAEIFAETKGLPYENATLSVPTKYNDYLEIAFGNWQSLPPIEARVGHSWGPNGECLIFFPKDEQRML